LILVAFIAATLAKTTLSILPPRHPGLAKTQPEQISRERMIIFLLPQNSLLRNETASRLENSSQEAILSISANIQGKPSPDALLQAEAVVLSGQLFKEFERFHSKLRSLGDLGKVVRPMLFLAVCEQLKNARLATLELSQFYYLQKIDSNGGIPWKFWKARLEVLFKELDFWKGVFEIIEVEKRM
jgi:hypothetical protein